MKFFKNTKLLVMVILVSLAASACGSTTTVAPKISLTMWGTVDTSQNMQQFITDFQKKYPNVKIQYTEKDYDTYESDLINALADGTGPDIYTIHNDWLPKYEDKLAPAPADAFTVKDYETTYVPVAVSDFVSAGQIYALPLSVDSLALYYNKAILGTYGIAEPPQTWNELSKDVQTMTSQDNTGYFTRSGVAMGTSANINHAQDILYLLMLQERTQPYTTDNSQSTLNKTIEDSNGNTIAPAATALSYYTSFSNAASTHYTWNAKSNYSVDAFANGQLAFMYGYSFAQDTLKQKSPNLDYGIAPVPQPNATATAVNFASYYGYGVSKQSKFSDAAWQFIKFMGSDAELTAYYARHKQPTSRIDLVSAQNNDLTLSVFATANLTAESFYKKDADAVNQIFSNMIDAVSLRSQSVNTALSTAAQQINQLYR